ncbi:hypothetical protein Q4E93_26420 [Flavitalea sp. BT771]|uniref:hypothetical protein n=1 Tax=Flavitalea sp. BT771 TaxID=3063329 RepID=UPI0026E1E330|nr:hypothetical protein [Flavitalea sp. BT771]MDO6434172.1 hypothetical protein [Flavitalea sp. BT771]MDV6223072.1 hypothetical protein [Flavitalea sp. BT771]
MIIFRVGGNGDHAGIRHCHARNDEPVVVERTDRVPFQYFRSDFSGGCDGSERVFTIKNADGVYAQLNSRYQREYRGYFLGQ